MFKFFMGFFLIAACSCASAASFDCSKIKSDNVPGYLICNTPELSKADDDFVALYKEARAKAPDQKAFMDHARAELKKAMACRAVDCLRQWYAMETIYYNQIIITATAPAPTPATSPSFDCGKINSIPEYLICNTPELSAADGNLKILIDRAREVAPDKQAFAKAATAQWNFRQEKCRDVECLKKWYTTEIAYYSQAIGVETSPASSPSNERQAQQPPQYQYKPPAALSADAAAPDSPAPAVARSAPVAIAQNQPDNQPSIDEKAFIQIVSAAQEGNKNAQNDMQSGGIKAQRDQLLCELIKTLHANNWVGKIKNVDANSDGKGLLTVEIAPDITLRTWNNSISDIGDKTLIEPSSPVFTVASALKQEQRVVFSGVFLKGDSNECIEESSLRLRRKIEHPEFIFRFSAISPI